MEPRRLKANKGGQQALQAKEATGSSCRGTRVAQLVKHPALGFGSSHDLMAGEFEPGVGLHAECGACLGFFLFLSLCPSPTHLLSPK